MTAFKNGSAPSVVFSVLLWMAANPKRRLSKEWIAERSGCAPKDVRQQLNNAVEKGFLSRRVLGIGSQRQTFYEAGPALVDLLTAMQGPALRLTA